MIVKTISHYKILEKIGSGGMGVVYKAEDTKLKRLVALKFLSPELTEDKEARDRFIKEAQSASALDHNNICTIFEINETNDNQLFIAMSHYNGETLRDRIDRGPLEENEALEIAIQIAEGLAKAHEKEIVHRDIKPENIFINKDGVVKILDFGLAKLVNDYKISKYRSTPGTVAYMSPEQARGEEVDERTDIWSLGVVLYEMLSGKLPFKGKNNFELATLQAIINDEPGQISRLRNDIPLELEKVIYNSLNKNSRERYQHINEMLLDFKSQLKKNEIKIQSQSNLKTKQSYNIKFLRYISIPFIFIFLILTWYWIFQFFFHDAVSSSNKWQTSIAILPCENISSDPDQDMFCQGMTLQLISELSRQKGLKVISENSINQLRGTSKTFAEIGKQLDVEHLLKWSIRKPENLIRITAQLINTKDGSFVWTQDYNQEFSYEMTFVIQDSICKKITSDLLPKLASSEPQIEIPLHSKNIEALKSYTLGVQYNEWLLDRKDRPTFELAKEYLEKAIRLDPDYGLAYAELADVYNTFFMYVKKTPEERKESIRLQKQYIEKALELNPNSAEVQTLYGYVLPLYIKPGEERLKKVLYTFRKAINLNSNYALAHRAIGMAKRNLGLWEHSIPHFTLAITSDPLNPGFYFDRGWAYYIIGEHEKAELDFKMGLEFDPNSLRILNKYFSLLARLKRYDEALSLSKRIDTIDPNRYPFRKIRLAILRGDKKPALEHINSTTDIESKLRYYALLGMREDALEYALVVKKIYEEDFGTRNNSDYLDYKYNPDFDIIRDDIRFKDMLTIMKRKYDELVEKWGNI